METIKKIMKIQVKTNPNLKIWQDWDNDGLLRYKGEKTINRYIEIKKRGDNIPFEKFDCFIAFNDKQFEEGIKNIRPLKEGEKYTSLGSGIYGTADGVERLVKHLKKQSRKKDTDIRQECVPEEVYIYEYNNYESCISYHGDLEAMKIIMELFGVTQARKIKRYHALYTIDQIKKEMDRPEIDFKEGLYVKTSEGILQKMTRDNNDKRGIKFKSLYFSKGYTDENTKEKIPKGQLTTAGRKVYRANGTPVIIKKNAGEYWEMDESGEKIKYDRIIY